MKIIRRLRSYFRYVKSLIELSGKKFIEYTPRPEADLIDLLEEDFVDEGTLANTAARLFVITAQSQILPNANHRCSLLLLQALLAYHRVDLPAFDRDERDWIRACDEIFVESKGFHSLPIRVEEDLIDSVEEWIRSFVSSDQIEDLQQVHQSPVSRFLGGSSPSSEPR